MTEVVAWLALVLAAGSLWVAYLAYRQGRPSISAEAHITVLHARNGDVRTLASVLVVNSSAVAVTVDDVEWWGLTDPWPNGEPERRRGPNLPYRLEGHSSQCWHLAHPFETTECPTVTVAQKPVKVAVTRDQLGVPRLSPEPS